MRPFTDSESCPKCKRTFILVEFVIYAHEDFNTEYLQHECSSCEYKWNTETAEAPLPESGDIPIILPDFPFKKN